MPNAKKTPAKAAPKKAASKKAASKVAKPKKEETPLERALRLCNGHLNELDYDTAFEVIKQLKDYYLKNIPPAKGLK